MNKRQRPVRKPYQPAKMLSKLLSSDKVTLGRAITLIESKLPKHRELAQELLTSCLPHSGQSLRIGITGSPGVGKSTFIESLGNLFVSRGNRVAILAVDPSSQVSHGSILGDKTRMTTLASHPDVFIRPSPAGKTLGGVAQSTRQSIVLCETAGFDVVIVETVGVGQSEITVHGMTDCFLLLLLPGAGDELQGIKKGVVEMADIIVINKVDGNRETLAKQTRKAYKNALHFMPPRTDEWQIPVALCSALQNFGMEEVMENINHFARHTKTNQAFSNKRMKQSRQWLKELVEQRFWQMFTDDNELKQLQQKIENEVIQGKTTPLNGAAAILQHFYQRAEK